VYIPKITRINDQKNINKIGDVARTVSNPSFYGSVNGSFSKDQFMIYGKGAADAGFNRTVNFDFVEGSDGVVTVFGGKIRIHGKRVISVPSKDILITGGTIENPSYTYVKIIVLGWSASIEYSLTEPLSNNNEICVPLQCWASEYRDGKYYYQYLSTCYFGDIQFANIIAE